MDPVDIFRLIINDTLELQTRKENHQRVLDELKKIMYESNEQIECQQQRIYIAKDEVLKQTHALGIAEEAILKQKLALGIAEEAISKEECTLEELKLKLGGEIDERARQKILKEEQEMNHRIEINKNEVLKLVKDPNARMLDIITRFQKYPTTNVIGTSEVIGNGTSAVIGNGTSAATTTTTNGIGTSAVIGNGTTGVIGTSAVDGRNDKKQKMSPEEDDEEEEEYRSECKVDQTDGHKYFYLLDDRTLVSKAFLIEDGQDLILPNHVIRLFTVNTSIKSKTKIVYHSTLDDTSKLGTCPDKIQDRMKTIYDKTIGGIDSIPKFKNILSEFKIVLMINNTEKSMIQTFLFHNDWKRCASSIRSTIQLLVKIIKSINKNDDS